MSKKKSTQPDICPQRRKLYYRSIILRLKNSLVMLSLIANETEQTHQDGQESDHIAAWAQIRENTMPWVYPLSFLLRIWLASLGSALPPVFFIN